MALTWCSMFASAINYGRLLARTVVPGWGITAEGQNRTLSYTNSRVAQTARQHLQLLTASSGYAKANGSQLGSRSSGFGDDAYFVEKYKLSYVIGVADGVGGWREYGVDPSQLPNKLMSICARLVQDGRFDPTTPSSLLEQAYQEVAYDKEPVIGSTTACLISLDSDSKLHTVNLGDSGYMVVRNGRVLNRSQEQQHYFNTPFQLSSAPPSFQDRVLSDSPSQAATESIDMIDGDIIVLATDGLFDNMTDNMILMHLRCVKPRVKDTIQTAADEIAHQARKLSKDPDYMSPFSKAAASNGYQVRGGKPDDITVLIAAVNSGELGEFIS